MNKEEILRTAKKIYFKNSYYLESTNPRTAWRMAVKLSYMVCFKVRKFSNYYALVKLGELAGKKFAFPMQYLINDLFLEGKLDELIDSEFEKKFLNKLVIENE